MQEISHKKPRSFTKAALTSYLHNKNIDLATFGDAVSPEKPEDLNITDATTRYDDVILYLRNEISRLRKFIGFDQIDTKDGETGKYKLLDKNYDFVFGYRQGETLNTGSEMTCLLDYVKQFANIVRVYEGILAPEETEIDFGNLDDIK